MKKKASREKKGFFETNKAFLSSGIPDLQLDSLVVDVHLVHHECRTVELGGGKTHEKKNTNAQVQEKKKGKGKKGMKKGANPMVGSSFSENSFLTRRRTRQVFPVLISPRRTILRPFSPPPDLSPPPPPPRTGFFFGALLKQLPILQLIQIQSKLCVTHSRSLETTKHSC